MPFVFSIPTDDPNRPLRLSLDNGEMLFVLGANGTGKSSLMQLFASVGANNTRRITAHRQTWFRSGSPEFTAKYRADIEQGIVGYDGQEAARWMDEYAMQRPQMAIYDLVNADNVRSRKIASAADQGKMEQVAALADRSGALTTMNRILRQATLSVAVGVADKNDELVASRSGGSPYSIARLSDGERNAILIAANVLTSPPGTLLLIDEPERHLHRSIVSPLITSLLSERPDCMFIVATHEPQLPVDVPNARVLLTRGCIYIGNTVASFDIDSVESTDEIDDSLKRTLFGERRTVVFVEGKEHSLDKALYGLLFPHASIVAKDGCRAVEQAVTGIKGSSSLHWVHPFGLVDSDHAGHERIDMLRSKDVYALSVYSVESIYYHPEMQKRVAGRNAMTIGGDVDSQLKQAIKVAIAKIRDNAKHLSTRIAEKAARAKVFSLLPQKNECLSTNKRVIELDYRLICEAESTRLESLLRASNFIDILKHYPIRETPALDAIARALNFAGRTQYEAAVRKLLADDPTAVDAARSLLGDLPSNLFA